MTEDVTEAMAAADGSTSGGADPRGGLRLVGISLDALDHRALADFYVTLLGGELLWANDGSAGVQTGGYTLVAQHVPGHREPAWPGTSILHLDLSGDVPVAESVAWAVRCGARVADHQPDPRWTVLLDPAGHPFCITPFTSSTA